MPDRDMENEKPGGWDEEGRRRVCGAIRLSERKNVFQKNRNNMAEFRFAPLGLNRKSRESLRFSAFTFFLELMFCSFCCFGGFLGSISFHFVTLLFIPGMLLLGVICLAGVVTACVALMQGVIGLLEPNPGFGRALCVAVLPFAAFMPGVNIVILIAVCYHLETPTGKERDTAAALGTYPRKTHAASPFDVIADLLSSNRCIVC